FLARGNDTKVSNNNSQINIEKLSPLLKTDPNTAFFWSGRTNGVGGAEIAEEIAKSKSGVTLESTIKDKEIDMPEWNFNNPNSIKAWEDVSAEYARQVEGEIRAVVGKELREGNIWENVELPRLISNQQVTRITVIDPVTKVEKIIFER
ncbi:MAG: transposase, partial [Lysinibacillus sp.]